MWNLPNAVWTVAKEEAFSWYFSFLGGHFLGRRTNYERNAIVMPVVFVVLAKRLVTHFWNWSRWSLTALMTRLENTLLHIHLFYLRAKANGVVFFCRFPNSDHQLVSFIRVTFFPHFIFRHFTRFIFYFCEFVGSESNCLISARRMLKANRHAPFFFFFPAIMGSIDIDQENLRVTSLSRPFFIHFPPFFSLRPVCLENKRT